jgi:hypothetical protein
LEVP